VLQAYFVDLENFYKDFNILYSYFLLGDLHMDGDKVKELIFDRTSRVIRPEVKKEFMIKGMNTSDHAVEIERETLIRTKNIKRLIFGD